MFPLLKIFFVSFGRMVSSWFKVFMGQCVVFYKADEAVVVTVLLTAHSVSFGKQLTFPKLFNLSFFLNFLPAGRCWKPSQCSHKVPVDFVFALATLPNKTSVNLNLIENLLYGLLIVSNLTYLHSLLLVSVFKWLITLSTW